MITRYDTQFLYINSHRYGHVSSLTSNSSLVLSAEGQNIYCVTVQIESEGNVECACTCPAYSFRKNACKHIVAVMIQMKLKKPAADIPLFPKVLLHLMHCFRANHSFFYANKTSKLIQKKPLKDSSIPRGAQKRFRSVGQRKKEQAEKRRRLE